MRAAYYETEADRLLITFLLKFKVFNLLNSFKLIRKAFFYIIVSFSASRIFNCAVTQLLIYLFIYSSYIACSL